MDAPTRRPAHLLFQGALQTRGTMFLKFSHKILLRFLLHVKSWEAGAAEGGAVGSQRPSPSAWGIPAPWGGPAAPQPRHPRSGVSCSPSSLFNDKSGQEKRAFPHVWTRAGAGPGRGLAVGAFAAQGSGRVSLLAPSAFLTKTRGTVVAFVTCGSW